MKRLGAFRLLLLSSCASAVCGTSMLALAIAGLPEKSGSVTAEGVAAIIPRIQAASA